MMMDSPKLIIIFSISLLLTIIHHAYSFGLYDDDPYVLSLNDKTFLKSVLNQDYLLVINYYKHWSPTCQRFSKLFSNYSRDVKSWNKVVQFASIDCAENLFCYQALADSSATIIGREDNDNGDDEETDITFPIIQYIPPGSKELNQYSIRQFQVESILDLHLVTINEIISNKFISNQYSLVPIVAKSITEICYTLGLKDDKEHYAIIESIPSEFGAMVILDLVNFRRLVTIKRFIGDHHLMSSLFSHHVKLPIILEISPSCQYKLIGNIKNLQILRKEFVSSIKSRFVEEEEEEERDNNKQQRKMMTIFGEVSNVKVNRYNLSYSDLYNTIRYSLVHEITSRKSFNSRQLEVIKQIYSIILHYFPFDNENVRRFFKRMSGWLENRKTDLPVERYLSAIKTSDGFLKPMEGWRHCNGSRPIYRGYPCGFWVLFHAMTIQEYNITVTTTGRTRPIVMDANNKPVNVLQGMRNYVGTFFTCQPCREYFLNVSNNLEQELIYPNSSVLWLWKIHNQMNSRLSMEDGDFIINDPYYPKYQFPTKELCPTCLSSKPNDGQHHGQYDEQEIFKFLYNFYSKSTIKANSSVSSYSLVDKYLFFFITTIWTTIWF